jgi:hypothetical protein
VEVLTVLPELPEVILTAQAVAQVAQLGRGQPCSQSCRNGAAIDYSTQFYQMYQVM